MIPLDPMDRFTAALNSDGLDTILAPVPGHVTMDPKIAAAIG